jgi:hypothetical protein
MFLAAFIFLRGLTAYFFLKTKEFRQKLFYLLFIWLFSFLSAFASYEQFYSFELGELLEENVMLRDPQQFVLLLYYHSTFWAFYFTVPLGIYSFLTYWFSSITYLYSLKLKGFFVSLNLLQVFSLFFVYRWVFPEWILALGFVGVSDDAYIFEPDRFQIYRAFFEETFNVFCFASIRALFIFFSMQNKFFVFWRDNRMLTIFILFVSSWIRLGQRILNLYLAFSLFFIFNFRGFILFLNAYLNAFKFKPFLLA